MSKTSNKIPTISGNITLYAFEKADCFRTCFDHENCHYVGMEIVSNGVYCMIYLTDGLVDFTLTSSSGTVFYTIECTGNTYYHCSSWNIVVKTIECLITCVGNLGCFNCTLFPTTYGPYLLLDNVSCISIVPNANHSTSICQHS